MKRLALCICVFALLLHAGSVIADQVTASIDSDAHDGFMYNYTDGSHLYYSYLETGSPSYKCVRMGKGTYPMDAHFEFDISEAADADSIESATLRLYCRCTLAKYLKLSISGYNADSTVAVADTTAFLNVLSNLTSASAEDSIYYPTEDTWYEIDVTSVIRELHDRVNWTGHTILVAQDNGSETYGEFRAEAREDAYTDQAQLVVNYSNQQGGTGAVAGTVASIHDSTAIVGATVTVTPGSYSDTTDGSGEYYIPNIPSGSSYEVSVTASGYNNNSQSNVTVASNDTTDVDFMLTSTDSTEFNIQQTASSDGFMYNFTDGSHGYYNYLETGSPSYKCVRMGKGSYPMDAHFEFDISATAEADSIASATLKIFCRCTLAKTVDLRLYGYDADSTIAIADTTAFLSVLSNLTTAYEDESIYYPTEDAWYEIDVTSVIRELHERANWSGHTIIVATDNGSEPSGEFRAEAIEDFYTDEARLDVDYIQMDSSGTGAIAGMVYQDSDSTAITGAIVTVGSFADTTSNGAYYIPDVPVGSNYKVAISAVGCVADSITNVTVSPDDTTAVDNTYLVNYGWIKGIVRTADTSHLTSDGKDYPLQKIKIDLKLDGITVAEDTTIENSIPNGKGEFSFNKVEPGTYTINAKLNQDSDNRGNYGGYQDTTITNIVVTAGDTVGYDDGMDFSLETIEYYETFDPHLFLNDLVNNVEYDSLTIIFYINPDSSGLDFNTQIKPWFTSACSSLSNISGTGINIVVSDSTTNKREADSPNTSVVTFGSGSGSASSDLFELIEYYPYFQSDINFDTADEDHWDTQGEFIYVATHEIGHSIGLWHSAWPNIMNNNDNKMPDGNFVTITDDEKRLARSIWPIPPSTLTEDTKWLGTYVPFYNNVAVPNGKTLIMRDGIELKLNGHSLTTQAGGTIQAEGSVLSYDDPIYMCRDGSSINIYPTHTQAMQSTSNGDSIFVAFKTFHEDSTLTLGANRIFMVNGDLSNFGGLSIGDNSTVIFEGETNIVLSEESTIGDNAIVVFQNGHITTNENFNIGDNTSVTFEDGGHTFTANDPVSIGENTSLYFGYNYTFDVRDSLYIDPGIKMKPINANLAWAGIELAGKMIFTGTSNSDTLLIRRAKNGIVITNTNCGLVAANKLIVIKESSNNGLIIDNCSPYIRNVYVDSTRMESFQWGAINVIGANASPYISDVTLINNEYGLRVDQTEVELALSCIENNEQCCIKFADYKATLFMWDSYNNICPSGSNYAIENLTNSYITTTYNCWWGTSTPIDSVLFQYPSRVTTINNLTSYYPNIGAPKAAFESMWDDIIAEFSTAVRHELHEDWELALELYRDILTKTSDQQLRKKAIANMLRIHEHYDRDYTELHTLI